MQTAAGDSLTVTFGSDEPVSLPARPMRMEVSMARVYRCDGCVVVVGSCVSGSCGVHVAVAAKP